MMSSITHEARLWNGARFCNKILPIDTSPRVLPLLTAGIHESPAVFAGGLEATLVDVANSGYLVTLSTNAPAQTGLKFIASQRRAIEQTIEEYARTPVLVLPTIRVQNKHKTPGMWRRISLSGGVAAARHILSQNARTSHTLVVMTDIDAKRLSVGYHDEFRKRSDHPLQPRTLFHGRLAFSASPGLPPKIAHLASLKASLLAATPNLTEAASAIRLNDYVTGPPYPTSGGPGEGGRFIIHCGLNATFVPSAVQTTSARRVEFEVATGISNAHLLKTPQGSYRDSLEYEDLDDATYWSRRKEILDWHVRRVKTIIEPGGQIEALQKLDEPLDRECMLFNIIERTWGALSENGIGRDEEAEVTEALFALEVGPALGTFNAATHARHDLAAIGLAV